MTISKAAFEAIVVELVESDGATTNDWHSHINFAHALIKRVEAESDVIGYTADDEFGMAEFVESHFVKLAGGQLPFPNAAEVKHLIALPLVSEESHGRS